MTATLAYLRDHFDGFNRLYFDGSLPTPTFKISNSRTMLGSLSYPRRQALTPRRSISDFTLRISAYYDLTPDELDDTIIHEMIHLYIACNNVKDDSTHGRVFRAIMENINTKGGRHITVTHRGALPRASHRKIQNIVAVTELQDGTVGVTRVAPSRVMLMHRMLPHFYRLKTIRWYNSSSPYFDTLPRAQKPRIYRADIKKLNEALADAIPLNIDNDKITRL